MKGRRLTIVLVMLLVLICALAFVGCQEKQPNEPVTPQQPEHTHVAFLVEAKEATCTEEGNNAYYLCTCGLAFKDEAMTIPTYAYSEVIAKKDHVYNKTEVSREALKEAATCQSAAVYYYSCTCGAIDNGENANTFVFGEKAAHNTVYVPAVDATCETAGNIAYYTCGSCGIAFKDAEATQQFSVTETVVVPAEGHVTTAHERVEPTCTEAGVAAYWSCNVCGKMFSDAGCTNVITTANRAIPKLGHEYSEQLPLAQYKATDATCSAVATYYCSCVRCGEAGTATFGYGEKAPHTPEVVAAVAPTCTSDGNIEYYSCKVCSVLFSDPACTTEVAYSDVVIAKLGHVYNQEVATSAYLKTPATCLSQAVYFKSCICGNFSEDTFTAGDYGAHVMTEAGYHASVAPDCEKDGSIAYFTCSVCSKDCTLDGKEIKNAADKVVAALGHDYAEIADADNLVDDATCTRPAKYKKVCTRCDQAGSETFSYGEKLAHSFEAWTERKESDCVTDGNVRYRHCVTCKKNYDEFETEIVNVVIEKLGHDFNGKVVDDRYLATAATCTAPAQYYRSCTRCEMSSKEDSTLTAQLLFEVGDALGHKLGTIIAKVDADCLNDGLMAHYECERCSVYFNEEKTEVKLADIIIEKLGHDFTAQKAEATYLASAATCTQAAKYYCSCTRCALADTTTFESGDALGHTYGELIVKVDPTCTTTGMDAHYVCSVCSVWFTSEKVETTQAELVIEALGHDYTRQVVAPEYVKSVATCVSPAIYYYSCYNCNSTSCGTEFEQTFEAGSTVPHVYGDWTLRVEPTCTEDGNIKYRHCSVCDKDYDEFEVEATSVVLVKLGHDFTAQIDDEKYLIAVANCTEAAKYYYSCTRCELAGSETFENGEALGHSYGELIARVEPTYVTEGTIAHYTCSACAKNFDESKKEVTDLSVPRTLPTAGVGTYDKTGKYLPGQYVVSVSGENAVYGDLPYAVERKNGAYVISGRLIYDANTKNYPYIIRFDADFATYYSKVADNTVILKYAYADGKVYATFTKADAFANDFSFIFKGDALKGDAQCLFLDPTVATEDWIVYQISIGSDVVCPKEVPAAEATYWYNGWNTYYVDMLREGKYFADIDCKTELTAEQVFVKEKLSISGMTAGINAQVGIDAEEKPVYGFTTSSAYSVVMVNGVYTVVGNIACNNDRSDVSSVKLVVRIDGNFKQFYRVIAHETVIVRLTVGENVVEITKGNTYFTEDGAIVIIFALEKGQTLTVDVLNPLTEKFDALTYTIVVDDGATYVHNMEVRNAIPATYWSEGCTEYVECADCGKQVGYKVVEKLVPTMTPILSDEAHVYTVSYKDGKYVISGNPKFELPEGNLEAGYRVKIKFGCEFGNAYAGFADTDVIIVVNVGGTEYKITKADLDEDGGFTLTLNVTEEMEFSITFINPDEEGENAVYSFIVKGITNA